MNRIVSNLYKKALSLHLSQRQITMILAVAVGLISGLVAVVLKNGVYWIQWLLSEGIRVDGYNFLYVLYPLFGLLVTTWIVRRLLKRHPGPGIPTTLYAISKRKSRLRKSNIYSSLVTSIFTVGFGGSAGLEAPAVQTSAAIGSNLGASFNLNYKTKTLLIGCAAAGSLASIFKAPVAAIIFAVEVFMLDLTTVSLVPLLLASISALLTANMFLGTDDLLRFQLRSKFELSSLPYFVLLGVFTGICSLYFSKLYMGITRTMERVKKSYLKVVIGGLILGLIIFAFPPLYGEGYETINYLLNDDLADVAKTSFFYDYRGSVTMMLVFMLGLVILKVVATGLTLGSGGVGGIFAPSLFMGSTLGFLFARIFKYFKIEDLDASQFTLVGMAGLISGVLHAPLTAIFMIAEITGGYELFLPLMLTSAIAYSTSKALAPHTIYTQELAQRGELITHDKDKAVLTLMNLKDEIETGFVILRDDFTLRQIVVAVQQSTRNIFPVLDMRGRLVGIVTLDDIRQVMFDQTQYDELGAVDFMSAPLEIIFTSDNMEVVMNKFEESQAWNLPVIQEDVYVGFVSKSRLFNAYRTLLREASHTE
ncbi:MAG: chloride channel protein [Flavobacteriales bacterium]|nr:chloride channel protein [Flavobacteriales bacterium]